MDLLPVKKPCPNHHQQQQILKYEIKTKNICYKISKHTYFSWVNFTTHNIVNNNTTRSVLKNINCEARPGELTAIAGPSGSGKTTLLEIFSGTISPSSGYVLVNDSPMNVTHFRTISGYVTQDDALFPLLTVEETLIYSTRLRLKVTRNEARLQVAKLLQELGLDHIARSRVGDGPVRGISGGEKRRLSIGVELAHDPIVLFLDEPTSGLDSGSALHVMLMLKSMAKNQSKTVLLTIHQPGFRILDLFDRVMLLSNGSIVHKGSLEMLEDTIRSAGYSIPRHVNALEFAIDVMESLEREEANDHEIIESNPSNCVVSYAEEDQSHVSYCNSRFEEVIILSQRLSRNIFRTKQLIAARTIQSLLAGIIFGTIFIDSFSNSKAATTKLQNQLGFFAFTLTFLMSSTTEALPIFLQEKKITARETSRGAYRVSSYVISNTIVFLPFLLTVALLYSTPVYFLVGLRRDSIDGFAYFSLVVYMVVLMSNSFVACFSAFVPDFSTGMSLIAGFMGSFFLFSGYFLSKETIPRCWGFMQWLSLFKYPFECFMINQYGGEQGKMRCLESVGGGECLMYGGEFLVQQHLKESMRWSNVIVMVGFVIGYRFVGYVILLYFSCRSRR